MKIAILTPTFSYFSGIDRVVEQQAMDYAKKGNKVKVIALEGDIKPNLFIVNINIGLFIFSENIKGTEVYFIL